MTLLFRDDPYLESCTTTGTAADGNDIVLDRTVFYPTGGGQPGDTGVLRWAGGDLRIVDTVKGDGPDAVLHVPEADSALPDPALPDPGLPDPAPARPHHARPHHA